MSIEPSKTTGSQPLINGATQDMPSLENKRGGPFSTVTNHRATIEGAEQNGQQRYKEALTLACKFLETYNAGQAEMYPLLRIKPSFLDPEGRLSHTQDGTSSSNPAAPEKIDLRSIEESAQTDCGGSIALEMALRYYRGINSQEGYLEIEEFKELSVGQQLDSEKKNIDELNSIVNEFLQISHRLKVESDQIFAKLQSNPEIYDISRAVSEPHSHESRRSSSRSRGGSIGHSLEQFNELLREKDRRYPPRKDLLHKMVIRLVVIYIAYSSEISNQSLKLGDILTSTDEPLDGSNGSLYKWIVTQADKIMGYGVFDNNNSKNDNYSNDLSQFKSQFKAALHSYSNPTRKRKRRELSDPPFSSQTRKKSKVTKNKSRGGSSTNAENSKWASGPGFPVVGVEPTSNAVQSASNPSVVTDVTSGLTLHPQVQNTAIILNHMFWHNPASYYEAAQYVVTKYYFTLSNAENKDSME